MKKELYPFAEEVKQGKYSGTHGKYGADDEPDMIKEACGYTPNYDKFDGWSAEDVLVWLNID